MTHDDVFDQSTFDHEREYGIQSTFFLLSNQISRHHDSAELHFDKAYGTLDMQVYEFYQQTGRFPTMNRTHRLFWRSDFFDLAFLCFKGFTVDSTIIGNEPYRLCVEGKLLPIWEVPITVSDRSSDGRLIASWNRTRDIESLFRESVTPIVANCHANSQLERLRMKSDFERICKLKEKYAYTALTMKDFYQEHLKVFSC